MATHSLPERDPREGRRPMMRIPLWYKEKSFQYNGRCGLGFVPGLFLMGVVCGKTFVASALIVVMMNLLSRSFGHDMIQISLVVGGVFVCQLVNLYCMVPLMLHSVLNIPLFMIFHSFIVIIGLWAVIQIKEFRKQDPRVTLLAEKGLFLALPAINLILISWITITISGREYLPIVLAVTGIFLVSLFIVPLQTSFVKTGTPLMEALIINQSIGLLYLLTIALLPGIVYSALYSGLFFRELYHLLLSQLFYTGPGFVLTLLEAQGIFEWFGSINYKFILLIRWTLGVIAMGSLSTLLYKSASSTEIPSLSILLLFSFLGYVSALGGGLGEERDDESVNKRHSIVTLTLLAILIVIAIVMATMLPWNISYYFSMMSLPLTVLQIVLVFMCVGSFLLLFGWRKDLTLLWPTYHALFVGCEYILHDEGYYPLSLLLVTAFAAVLLCLRLHTVGRLPLPLTILCLCIHILKLTQSFPVSFMSSPSLVSLTGLLLMGLAIIKLNTSEGLSLTMFFVLCIILTIGNSLSVQLLIAPVWTLIAHTSPSLADLAAYVCGVSGAAVNYFILRVNSNSAITKTCQRYLSPCLFSLSGLIWLLQPDFNPLEIHEAMGVVFLHHGVNIITQITGREFTNEQLLLLAWTAIIKWIIIIYYCIVMAALTLQSLLPRVTLQAAGSLFIGSFSLLISLKFGHHTPFSLLGVLYTSAGLIVGLLLVLLVLKETNRPSCIEGLMLLVLCSLCGVTLFTEWSFLPSHVNDAVTLPSGILFLTFFIAIAATLKIKSVINNKGRSILPLLANSSCLMSFILAITIQLPVQLDIALKVTLSSCLLLLLQADGLIIATSRTITGLFIAPCLVMSSLTLFVLSFLKIIDDLSKDMSPLGITELLVLFSVIPGQIQFLSSLWKGSRLQFSPRAVFFYILPNALLMQFGGSVNSVLGCTAVFSFCLIAIAEYQTLFVV